MKTIFLGYLKIHIPPNTLAKLHHQSPGSGQCQMRPTRWQLATSCNATKGKNRTRWCNFKWHHLLCHIFTQSLFQSLRYEFFCFVFLFSQPFGSSIFTANGWMHGWLIWSDSGCCHWCPCYIIELLFRVYSLIESDKLINVQQASSLNMPDKIVALMGQGKCTLIGEYIIRHCTVPLINLWYEAGLLKRNERIEMIKDMGIKLTWKQAIKNA